MLEMKKSLLLDVSGLEYGNVYVVPHRALYLGALRFCRFDF